jgi:cytidyltransferase-like protein
MKLGVIVGRFQIDELHEGHQRLIRRAYEECDKVLVLIGTTVVRTPKDPLPYHLVAASVKSLRNAMVDVDEIKDHPNDDVWKDNLVRKVITYSEGYDEVVYYGGRDSFLEHLPEECTKIEIDSIESLSSTNRRNSLGYRNELLFRMGYITAVQDEYQACYAVADLVALSRNNVLIGRKKNGKWVIPGGFADDGDGSLEASAVREALEETGIYVPPNALDYVASRQTNIWNYSGYRQPFTTCFWTEWNPSYGIPHDTDELTDVGFVPVVEALKLLEEGNHKDFLSIAYAKYNAPSRVIESLKEYLGPELMAKYEGLELKTDSDVSS